MLAMLAGSHGAAQSWPVGRWRVLSLVGSADETSMMSAELPLKFHSRARPLQKRGRSGSKEIGPCHTFLSLSSLRLYQ